MGIKVNIRKKGDFFHITGGMPDMPMVSVMGLDEAHRIADARKRVITKRLEKKRNLGF